MTRSRLAATRHVATTNLLRNRDSTYQKHLHIVLIHANMSLSMQKPQIDGQLSALELQQCWIRGHMTRSSLGENGVTDSLSYRHLLQMGRLRLGRMLEPWRVALTIFPTTFGLGLYPWYSRAVSQTIHHLNQPYALNKIRRRWLVLVPGYHFIMFYRLAQLVVHLEVVDGYRKTSPILTVAFATFPPAAAFYLQSQLNYHWRSHVRSSL